MSADVLPPQPPLVYPLSGFPIPQTVQGSKAPRCSDCAGYNFTRRPRILAFYYSVGMGTSPLTDGFCRTAIGVL